MTDNILSPGKQLVHRGELKTIKAFKASWSLALSKGIPHVLYILWEGESKYERFASDCAGNFPELDSPGE